MADIQKKLPSLPSVTLNKNSLPSLPNVVLNKNSLPMLPSLPSLPNSTRTTTKPTNSLFVADYNDPTQINSIVDVIFAKDKINATAELFKNMFNPLLHKDDKGRWDPQLGVFALNSLIHAGEIMDIAANPVKALLIGIPTGESLSNLKKAVNWDGTGRYNFDYDVAPGSYWDGVLNLALEVVSDPLNFISFGTVGAAKAVAKGGMSAAKETVVSVVKNAVQDSFKTMGREITEETATHVARDSIEKVAKRTAVEFLQDSDGTVKTALKDITDKTVRDNTVKELYAKAFHNNLMTEITHKQGIKGKGIDTLIEGLKAEASELPNYLLEKNTSVLLNSLKNVYTSVNAIDRFVFRTGMSTVGIYPIYRLAKAVAPENGNIVKRLIDKKLTAVIESPIAYKARDAKSVVDAVKVAFEKDAELQEILKQYNCGEITAQDFGDALCDRMSGHIDNIKTIIEKNLKDHAKDADKTPSLIDTVNLMVQSQVGFKDLDEYIESMLSLRGHVSIESERRIYDLIKLRNEVEYLDNMRKIDTEVETLRKQAVNLDSSRLRKLAQESGIGVKKNSTRISARATKYLDTAIEEAKDDIFAEGAAYAYRDATKVLLSVVPKCNTIAELSELISKFYKYTNIIKAKIFNGDEVAAKAVETINTLVMEAYKPLAKVQYTKAFITFTEENVKNYIDTIAFKSFLSASNEGLVDKARLNTVLDSVNAALDTLIHNKVKAAPDLTEAAQAYSETLQKQLADAFDKISPNIREFNTFSKKLNEALHIETASYTEAITKKLEEVRTRIKELKGRTQTVEQISKTAEKQLDDAYTVGNNLFKFIESIDTDARKLNITNLEEIRTSPEFKENTTAIIKWLDEEFDVNSAALGLSVENRNLTDNAIETLQIELSEASDTLHKFAAGETVLFEDLEKARHTLIKVRDLHTKYLEDFKASDMLPKVNGTKYYKKLQRLIDLESKGKIGKNEYLSAVKKLREQYGYLNLAEREAALKANSIKTQEQLEFLTKYIDAINPERIRADQVKIAADAVYYSLKGEQLANIMAYIGNPELVKQLTEMYSVNHPFYRHLTRLAQDVSEKNKAHAQHARELLQFGENFIQYMKTHDEIMQLGNGVLTAEEVTALRSTIEKFARTSLMKADMDFDELVNDIIKQTEDYYNYSFVWDKSFAQDKILARNKIYETKYGIKGYYHRADTDAEATFRIRQEELEVPKEYEGYRPVAIDIETTDTSKTTQVVEIGTFDGTEKKLYKHMYKNVYEADIPSPSALSKSYSDIKAGPNDINDYAARVKAFYKDHIDENALSAKAQYEAFLLQLYDKGDNVVLVGHHITEFDRPTLIANFEAARVRPALIEKFKNTPILDNLIDLRAKDGYMLSLAKHKQDAIRKVLRNHIDRTLTIEGVPCFFDAGVKGMRESLSVFIKTALDEGATDKGVLELATQAQLLREAFTNAAKNTVAIKYGEGLPILTKSIIAELTPDMVSTEFKDFVSTLGKDITPTKILNSTPSPVNLWGYKKIVDVNKVLDWFVVATEEGYADLNRMKMYTKISQHLDSLASKLRNVPQLKDAKFVGKLQAFIKELQAAAKDSKSPINFGLASIWAECLRVDRVDPTASLAVGIRLYKRAEKTLPADFIAKYADVIDVLSANASTTSLKAYNVPASVIDYTDSLKAIKDNIDLNDAIAEMEVKQGANNVYTARQQFANNALKKTHDYVQHEQEYISEFSKDGLANYKLKNKAAMDKLCVRQTEDILTRSPEDLQKYMIYHRAPVMFLDKDDATLTALTKKLKHNADAYKKYNIEFFETDETFYIYFEQGTKYDYFVDDLGFHASFNGKQIDLKYDSELGLDVSDFRHGEELNAIFKQMGELTNGQSIGHLGNQLSKADIEKYFSTFPEELQAKLNIDDLTKSTMFEGFTFDAMNIGSLASRQHYNQFMPSDMTRLIANVNPQIITKANQKNLMLDYILDPAMRLDTMIKQYGEEAIVNKIKSGDYVVMSVMQDEKLIGKGFHDKGYRVVEFNPNNKKLWEAAMNKDNGAIIVPRHMYAEFYDKLNTSLLYDNPVYKVAHQIIYLTKLGMITTVGKVFRDVVESQLKAMIETKDILGVLKNDYKAYKNIKQYKKAVCDILSLSELDYDKLVAKGIDPQDFAVKYINNRFEAESLVLKYYDSLKDVLKMDRAKIFLPDNKRLYFGQISKDGIDENTFDTMHAILTESGALGQLPAWGKYTLELHKEKQARFAADYAKGLIGNQMLEKSGNAWQKAYDGMSNFGNLLMTPAQYMDQVNRVSMYLTLMDSGFVNPNSALGRISRTMFDATVKTDNERLMELAIPFYSFFKHNALYWAEAVEENPWLAKLFFDYLNRIQDESQVGTVSDFERLNNVSLQTAKLAGNLILTSSNERVVRETRISKKGNPYEVDVTKHDDQVTLKLNFPFMEAFQLASNPIGYFAGATNPVIQLALQSWIGNNPNVPKGVATMFDTYRPYNFDEGGRAELQGWTLIPFVGPTLQRWGPDGYAKKQYEETGFLGNLILPSVFGRLNRFDDVQFAESYDSKSQYKPYQTRKTKGKKAYTPRNYTKRYMGPVKAKSAYTKAQKPKIKSYNPNYYNQYNYSQRAYSNPYNYNKTQTSYTNKVKFYPYRVPRKPRPSVYKLLYNSYGKSRIQYLGLPRTVKNTSKALRGFFNYTR